MAGGRQENGGKKVGGRGGSTSAERVVYKLQTDSDCQRLVRNYGSFVIETQRWIDFSTVDNLARQVLLKSSEPLDCGLCLGFKSIPFTSATANDSVWH